MARYRTLDGDLWKHSDLRKAPLQIGWLYAYIITAEADDEGRFVVDAWALADRAFSHAAHGVGEEEVAAALRYLHECGRVLLYEVSGSHFGFLTGWYEHQYIQSDRRQSSSLPPPPCDINSWVKADEVRQECADERGFDIRKITYQEALRWNQQRGYQVDNDPITECQPVDNPRLTDCKPESDEPDTKPREGKGALGLQTDNPGLTNGYPEGEGEGEVEKEGKRKNDSLFDASDEAPHPDPKPSKQEQLAELRDGVTSSDLDLIDEYLDNAASENKTGHISLGRRVNETRELLQLREDLGEQPWRYGIAQSNRAGAPNINYVKKAAGSWQQGSSSRGGGYSGRGMKPVSNWERRAEEENVR